MTKLGQLIQEACWRELVTRASTEVLRKLWNEWDGMAPMLIDAQYVPESYVMWQLQERGEDAHI